MKFTQRTFEGVKNEYARFLKADTVYQYKNLFTEENSVSLLFCAYLAVGLSVCLPACLSFCPPDRLFVCLSVCPSVYLSVSPSHRLHRRNGQCSGLTFQGGNQANVLIDVKTSQQTDNIDR